MMGVSAFLSPNHISFSELDVWPVTLRVLVVWGIILLVWITGSVLGCKYPHVDMYLGSSWSCIVSDNMLWLYVCTECMSIDALIGEDQNPTTLFLKQVIFSASLCRYPQGLFQMWRLAFVIIVGLCLWSWRISCVFVISALQSHHVYPLLSISVPRV